MKFEVAVLFTKHIKFVKMTSAADEIKKWRDQYTQQCVKMAEQRRKNLSDKVVGKIVPKHLPKR